MVTIVTRAGKGSPLTNNEVDANFTNLDAAVQPAGGTAGQILAKVNATDFNSTWIDNYSTALKIQVKNNTGSTINKGAVVYAIGGTGANLLIGLAKADAEATSTQTLGFLDSTLATGGIGFVIFTGTISGINTSAYAEGDPVYLSPTTAGGIIVGAANKPLAPAHLVYLGTITRSSATVGEIQIRVSNGWELSELHDVAISTGVAQNDFVVRNGSNLWVNQTPTQARTSLGLGSAALAATTDFDPAGAAVALAIALG
jgi:hypothetical protein